MSQLNRNTLRTVSALVFSGALAAAAPSLAQGSDDMWEITSRMEMPGMPMAIPGQVAKVCVPKNGKDDEFIPRQGDCKLVDGKRAGNKYTYKMACASPEPSTTEGEVVFGTGTYEGKMRMTMTKTNDTMQMSYRGQRVGSCTAIKK
jgi:hypothetical protein